MQGHFLADWETLAGLLLWQSVCGSGVWCASQELNYRVPEGWSQTIPFSTFRETFLPNIETLSLPMSNVHCSLSSPGEESDALSGLIISGFAESELGILVLTLNLEYVHLTCVFV